MKLLLDEHYSPEIARQLRERGFDVVAVKERAELVRLDDRSLRERAREEGRAIVTEDVADFVVLVREAIASRREHAGVIFAHPRSFSRSKARLGALVSALASLLAELGEEGALRNQVRWLQP